MKLKNVISFLFFFFTSSLMQAQVYDITPVYPYNYAVVHSTNITFQAKTSDSLAPALNYIFEVDTTDAFNSPVLITQTIDQIGGFITWAPILPIITDSIVYFWRVSIDSAYYGSYNWHESSFQHISGEKGWGQSHFFQFKNDSCTDIFYNKPDRIFEFLKDPFALQVQTGVYPNSLWNEEWYKLNDTIMDVWSCLTDLGHGLKFAVFNPVSGEPWYSHDVGNNTGQYGNVHCKAYDVPAFDFYTNSTLLRELITAFIDTVPDGYYILAYSHMNHYAEDYEELLYQAFESFGSANIRLLQNNTPYIIFGVKGSSIGTANEVIGINAQQLITLNDTIPILGFQGYLKSEIIGPASNWHSLHWRVNSIDPFYTDTVRLTVLGYNTNGSIDTLLKNIPPTLDSIDIYGLETFIDSSQYHYLKLLLTTNDSTFRTPSQLERWQVLYDPYPLNVGIVEHDLDSDFIVFPNPTAEYLQIQLFKESKSDSYLIEIINFKGQVIKSFPSNSGRSQIDISDLSSGLYYIKVMTDRGIVTKKFIKQ